MLGGGQGKLRQTVPLPQPVLLSGRPLPRLSPATPTATHRGLLMPPCPHLWIPSTTVHFHFIHSFDNDFCTPTVCRALLHVPGMLHFLPSQGSPVRREGRHKSANQSCWGVTPATTFGHETAVRGGASVAVAWEQRLR